MPWVRYGPARRENMFMWRSPVVHDIGEGLKMIAASEKYDRRVQVGFQNRSIREVMEAMKFLHQRDR